MAPTCAHAAWTEGLHSPSIVLSLAVCGLAYPLGTVTLQGAGPPGTSLNAPFNVPTHETLLCSRVCSQAGRRGEGATEPLAVRCAHSHKQSASVRRGGVIAARCGLEHTCSRPILSWMELWARPMRQKMPPKMTAEDTLLIARAMLVALSRLTWRLWWRMHDNLDHSLPSGIVVLCSSIALDAQDNPLQRPWPLMCPCKAHVESAGLPGSLEEQGCLLRPPDPCGLLLLCSAGRGRLG